MPDALAAQIDLSLAERPSLEEYRDAVGLTVVARGVNYGTGFEIALKIRELSGLITEAYSPADLMHGPIAAIQPGWPVVVVAPSGPARPSVEEIVPPLRARGARLFAVSDVRAVLRRAQTKLVLAPGVPEWLSPLTAVVPGQVAAMRLTQPAGSRPRQPGRPPEGDADTLGTGTTKRPRPGSRPPRVVLFNYEVRFFRTRTWIRVARPGSVVTGSPVTFLGARNAIALLAVAVPSARLDLCRKLTFEFAVSVKVRDAFFSALPW